ncbi:MAG: methyltransferase domain-containing protein [Bacteroidota bacterium]
MKKLNADYWERRWQDQQTGWDIGQASPPLMQYATPLLSDNPRILIPGAGRAYEALALHQTGFSNVMVCDWAATAFDHLRASAPNFPEEHLLVGDFFDLPLSGEVDLVLEQTFFCAIDPSLRPRYVEKMYSILRPGGRLAGVLFAKPFPFTGPPFGGTRTEYEALFSERFQILQLEVSPHSIRPRLGNEFFVELLKA